MRWVAFCLSFVLACGVGAAEPNPFAPEGVATEPRQAPAGPPKSKRETDAAIAYLDDFPASAEAARVAFDVYLAATVRGEASVADDMWTRLAFSHPRSVQHRFLLAVKKPEDYRKILVGAAKSRRFDREFADDFLEAVFVGLESGRAGEFLSGDEFLVRICLAIAELDPQRSIALTSLTAEQIAGKSPVEIPDPFGDETPGGKKGGEDSKSDPFAASPDRGPAVRKELLAACRARLEGGEQNREGRKVATVLFEEGLTEVERVLRLHAIEDGNVARLCEDHLYDKLSEADRAIPSVVESRVELLLDRERFAEARPAVERLLAEKETAKRLFWLGWCQASLGDASASETFAAVSERFPNDSWRSIADQAAGAVRETDARLAAQAEAAAGVVRDAAASDITAVELQAEFVPGEGPPMQAYGYLGLDDARGSMIEVLLRRSERVLLAAKSGADASRIFTAGDPSIHAFDGALPVPAATFDIGYDSSANAYNLDFNASVKWGASPKDAASTLAASAARTIARLELTTPAGVRRHLDRHVEKGMLPGPAESDETGTRYAWMTFSPRHPRIERTEFHVSKGGKLDRISASSLAIRDLRYGPAASFGPSPPVWPDLPVVQHQKFDAAMMFQMMTVATRLLTEEGPAEPMSAAVDASARR